MKTFVFLLFVTICQADMYDRDEEAFKFLSNMDMNQIAQAVEEEVDELMEMQLTENDIQWLRALADDFAESLQQELEKAVLVVMQSGHVNNKLTADTLDDLKRVTDDISNGLNMTEAILDKFVEDMTKGIDNLEESGLLDVDLDPIFQGISERALATFEDITSRKKRDLRDIFGHVDDTLHRVIGQMNGRFRDLHEFFKEHMQGSSGRMEPQIDNMKVLARNFITNIKAAQKDVLEHAVEFFTPYANKMGDVYVELMAKTQSRLQKLNERPIPAIYK